MKKLLSAIIATTLLLSFAFPVHAATASSGLPYHLDEYSDAYIEFTERLLDVGVSTNVCLEDFCANYSSLSMSMPDYIEMLIDQETSSHMGNTTRTETISINGSSNTYASPSEEWYDDIGHGSISLPQAPSYNKYNLLSTATKGDIYLETDGTLAQYTGHIALVQGKFYDSTYGYYIRTIEAGSSGVVYGVLEDSRYDDRGGRLYYVTDANTAIRNNAIIFAVNQLGKLYNWSGAAGSGACKTSIDSSNWYCSELVWAAYYNEGLGINIYGNTIPDNLYSPAALATSNKLTRRTVG